MFVMNLKLDKGQLEKSGKLALRVGKAVVVEGVKALVLKTAATAITSAFEGKGTAGVNLDTILGEEKENSSEVKVHDFTQNMEDKGVNKIDIPSKAVMRVEISPNEIKINTNPGLFNVLSEEILKLNVKDEIKTKEGVATVKDQLNQTDIKGNPYMVKTTFNVTDVQTGLEETAVLHAYQTKTYFMVQGQGVMQDKNSCYEFFFNNIMKQFIRETMKNRGFEIRFIERWLKAPTRPVHNIQQWKRKQVTKNDKCDICSRSFLNKQGVMIHKRRMHGEHLNQSKIAQPVKSLKNVNVLSRSDSNKSNGEHSRPSSTSPKKIYVETKLVKNKQQEIVMEESGSKTEMDGDQKID